MKIEDQIALVKSEGMKNLAKGLGPWGNPINMSLIALEARQSGYEYCQRHPTRQYIAIR